MVESVGEGAGLREGAAEGADEGNAVDAANGSGVGNRLVAVSVQTSDVTSAQG